MGERSELKQALLATSPVEAPTRVQIPTRALYFWLENGLESSVVDGYAVRTSHRMNVDRRVLHKDEANHNLLRGAHWVRTRDSGSDQRTTGMKERDSGACEGCPLRCDASVCVAKRELPPCAQDSADEGLMWLLEERQQEVPGVDAWLREFVTVHYRDVGVDDARARLQTQNGGSASLSASEPTPRQEVQIQITRFTPDELDDYLRLRCEGLSRKSATWLEKAAEIVWVQTGGEISREACGKLRSYTLQKYTDRRQAQGAQLRQSFSETPRKDALRSPI